MDETERPHGESTRNRILSVALELIAENGFSGTSTRQLSERLGFTKAALYYHFRTKDDLLEALVAPAIQDLEKLVQNVPDHPSVAARRQLLEAYVMYVITHLQLIKVLDNDPSVARRPALASVPMIYDELGELLAGGRRDVAQRTRVRSALGGIHSAFVHMGPGDDQEEVRRAALEAALGALGLPNALR